MASTSPASRLIGTAAGAQLRPLGLRRQGRSRLWLDDQGWWLGVVEFSPPKWGQGSGLQVGVMWLWQDTEYFSFNVSAQEIGRQDFRHEDQFAPVAEDLARRAAGKVEAFRRRFPDLAAVADDLTARRTDRGWSWEAWNAGVAAALVGDTSTARERFTTVLDDDPVAPWMREAQQTTRELLDLVDDRDAVRSWAVDRITSCRARLGLGPAAGLDAALGPGTPADTEL
ncbi:hypothetical protein [Streptomyces sp. NPDC093094]|uniref:hypothetical protein n=1 Tax=Streptomyces sp. NPDC093094 TaxID=3366026 RepID=UPI003828D6F8